MFKKIYITNLPSFYKINLFNRILAHQKLFVVFTHDHSADRTADFYKGDRQFEYKSIARLTTLEKILFIRKLLKENPDAEVIVGGWDELVFFAACLLHPKRKNSIILESSNYESSTRGIKGAIKQLFLTRISKAYSSGKSQANLLTSLGFKEEIKITRGVGIFNIVKQPAFEARDVVKNFLYVGRLSPEKNLDFVIKTFNDLPDLRLNIIGSGPEEDFLRSISAPNIIFHGQVDNERLSEIYQKNDVFVLASKSEPWGLVVEEALNNGLPVIISDKVGCADEIINDHNGLIFMLDEANGLKNAVIDMTNVELYNTMRLAISKMNFDKIAEEQVKVHLV